MIKLSEYLRENAMRQEDFAKRIGVSQPEVSRLIGGVSQPRPELAKRIERETGGLVMFYDWPHYSVFAPDKKHGHANSPIQGQPPELQPKGVR